MVPVELRNLSKRFGAVSAVDGVSLDIAAGSLFFLLGPSGCGKTTLLRMVAGFIEPDAGTVWFGERDVTHTPARRRNCGMVFQSYALWPHMTVAENVAFGLRVRKVSRMERERRVAAALRAVQMEELAARKPNQLSGGQQQRVALARAMVIEPDVLLLDEPLSNLDAKLRAELRTTIRDVCKAASITAIYVTHDQKEALSMADTLAVMRDGRVVQVGEPRALYQHPADAFVAEFLGDTNLVPATIAGRDGDTLLLDTPAGRLASTSSAGPRSAHPSGAAAAPSVGASVICSIRPESIRVLHEGDSPPAGANLVTGRVLDLTYLGEIAQHRIALPGELIVKALELNPRTPTAPGVETRLAIDPAGIVVLPADATSPAARA